MKKKKSLGPGTRFRGKKNDLSLARQAIEVKATISSLRNRLNSNRIVGILLYMAVHEP